MYRTTEPDFLGGDRRLGDWASSDRDHPGGGEEKALSLKKISALHNLPLSQAFYAGDSITDVQVFQEVNRAGGLTLAINGNAYAVREARLACLSGHDPAPGRSGRGFQPGRDGGGRGLSRKVGTKTLATQGIKSEWLDALFPDDGTPAVELYDLTKENREEISRKSTRFRKEVRGERVGGLG